MGKLTRHGPHGILRVRVADRSERERHAVKEHKLTLMGGAADQLRVPASVLQEAIGALVDGARAATRFAVEGESTRKGTRPAWLEVACAIEVTALSAGSAVIALEAPTLQAADPALFGADLFDGGGETLRDATAVDLFGEVLATVLEGEPDAVMADRALLDSCARFARVGGGGFSGIRLEGLRGRSAPLQISANSAERIERLRDETPAPRAVRVAGTLDTISASRANVTVTLRDGTKVPVLLEGHDPETLKALFNEEVVLSGIAHYRPSGRLLRVLGESIGPARAEDAMFEALPEAVGSLAVFEAEAQDERSGVSAFFGTWPGDESDEEFLEAIQSSP